MQEYNKRFLKNIVLFEEVEYIQIIKKSEVLLPIIDTQSKNVLRHSQRWAEK
jgi:hypothetical protein